MQKKLNIIFAGTPDFASPTLAALVEGGYNVVAVYTQPDKPFGRGRKLQSPPVKELALSYNIPVERPHNFKDELTIGTSPNSPEKHRALLDEVKRWEAFNV